MLSPPIGAIRGPRKDREEGRHDFFGSIVVLPY
jgi:hypothetical protein